MKTLVTALFLTVISAPVLSNGLPRSATFELSKDYIDTDSPNQFNRYIKRVQDMSDTQKSTDSLSSTLSPICVRGLELVKQLTPLLLESKDYSYQDEYGLSYANRLNLNPKYASYDVECIFRGHKGEDMKSKVKVTYSEKLSTSVKTVSISQKIKFK